MKSKQEISGEDKPFVFVFNPGLLCTSRQLFAHFSVENFGAILQN